MNQYFFRPLLESDAEAAYQLLQAEIDNSWADLGILPDELAHMGIDYLRNLIISLESLKLGVMLGAFDFENQLIACSGLTRNERLCSRHTARLITPCVKTSWQSQQLDKQLLEKIIQSCALSQIEQLNTEIANSTTNTLEFIKRWDL